MEGRKTCQAIAGGALNGCPPSKSTTRARSSGGASSKEPAVGVDEQVSAETQSARADSRRAQFRLWIFSYTILVRSSKKRASRLLLKLRGCRISKTHRRTSLTQRES